MQFSEPRLFRRRQFIIGPDLSFHQNWQIFRFSNNISIVTHPDLHVTFAQKNNKKILLLGYILDPSMPEYSDLEIAKNLIEDFVSISSIINSLERLTGRFALIISIEEHTYIFHDPCGLRQVYYCFDSHGNFWCASQPHLLAEILGFSYDPAMIEYRNLPLFTSGRDEFWFPCDLSPYKEIKYLLPNHFLDIKNKTVKRYWPRMDSFSKISLDESVDKVSHILQNTIRAATLRFDLKMGISAGCDSRKSLAAARLVKEKITFYTHTPIKGSEADIEIPAKLLPKLGLKHHVINIIPMDEEFKKYYELNNAWPRERHGHIAYSFLKHFGPDCVVLNSNISEYYGVWYWLPKKKINGRNLAMLRMLAHKNIIEELDKWLLEASPACKQANMNILVLFDLELRSRWVSQAVAEYDIAFETFNPYNNRNLFNTELSVDEKFRRGRSLLLPKKIIKNMWPDVLSEPINPEKGILRKLRKFILTRKYVFPISRNLRYFKMKANFKVK